MTDWKKASDFPLPNFGDNPAEYMLAFDVRSNLLNAGLNFLRVDPDPQFVSPRAYQMSMVRQAVGLTQNNFAVKYAPPTWDAVAAGFAAADSAFDWLKHLPVNLGGLENTASIYDAWVSGKGQLYDGRDPLPAGGVTGDGVNTATGQGAAPSGSIL